MSGKKGKTISTSETKAEALTLQSSAYGAAVPILHGTTRISGNLLDYLDFKAVPHVDIQSQGGKGGASRVTTENTTFTYSVTIVMLLGEGPIYGVPLLVVGKKRYTDATNALTQVNANYLNGAVGQAVWSPLTTLVGGSHAVSYSGLACVVAQDYDLGPSAQIENHSFVVIASGRIVLKTSTGELSADADPGQVATDWLSVAKYGVGISSTLIGDMTQYSSYCKAAGLLVSSALTEQAAAGEQLKKLADTTNSVPVLLDGQIHMVPMGDEPLSRQYVLADGTTLSDTFTYTPDLTPIYDLTPDSFLCDTGSSPIRITRKSPADAYNSVKLEYLDATQDYNVAVATARDQASIDQYGLREAPTVSAHWITNVRAANLLAQVLVRRFRYVLNTYEFSLPWNFARLVPTNLVTLTDPSEGLDRVPVRIETIEDDEAGYRVIAKEFPHSVSGWSSYTPQGVGGYKHNYNADPGDVQPPVFIEPPVELTTTGLEVWVATCGNDPNWGGYEAWVSYDGLTYKKLGTMYGGARYGTLSANLAAGSGGSTSVNLVGSGGQLLSGSLADATNLATLCWVRGTGGADKPEFFAYQSATLTVVNAYNLSGLVRGAYSSLTGAKPLGAQFVRVDQAILKGTPLQPSDIGTTLHFKFLSFNNHGGGIQDISTVTAYTYTVRGDMALLPPPNFDFFNFATQADGTRQFTWGWLTTAKPVDLKGAVIRYRQGVGPYDWADMTPFVTDDGFHTASPLESNLLLAGPYVFAIRTLDKYNVLAETPLFIVATLPDPRLGNAIEFVDEVAEGWLGTLTQAVRELDDGALVIRAADQATWATLPATWSAWTRWVWDPYTTLSYDTPARDLGTSVAVLPVVNAVADGDVNVQVATSPDGTTWSSWAAVAGPVVTRYIKIRVTLTLPAGSSTGPGVTPILRLHQMTTTYIGKVASETANDVSPAAFTGVHRIGTGQIRLPTQKVWAHISRVSVTLQSVSGGWSYSLEDKDLVNGPKIKIFNGVTLADPPLIDWTIEGIPS